MLDFRFFDSIKWFVGSSVQHVFVDPLTISVSFTQPVLASYIAAVQPCLAGGSSWLHGLNTWTLEGSIANMLLSDWRGNDKQVLGQEWNGCLLWYFLRLNQGVCMRIYSLKWIYKKRWQHVIPFSEIILWNLAKTKQLLIPKLH